MREGTVMKQKKQGLAVINSDSMKPAKPFIPDKYINRTKLNKFKKIKYFTKALLEIRDWGFSEEEVSSCANITAEVEKLIVWHKALTTYRKGDKVYIEFDTGNPDMVGK